MPEGTRTYRVVGIMARPGFEKNWSPGYTAISLLGENNLGTAPVSVWVELKNPGSGLRARVRAGRKDGDAGGIRARI